MSKESKALENVKREAGFPYFSTFYDSNMWKEDWETIENALKALEIIKEKKVYLPFIEQFDLKYYNEHCAYMSLYEYYLTQEEYELLKEVLL